MVAEHTWVRHTLSFIPRGGTRVFVSLAPVLALGGFLLAEALRFPQFGWAAWLSLLPLFAAIRLLSPARALAAGAVWGAGLFLSGVAGGGAPLTPSLLALSLLVGVPAIYAAAGSGLVRRTGFHPFLLGLGWVGVELALLPLRLPHGLLASTQGRGDLLEFVGSALGYVFVAYLIALVNAILLSALTALPLAAARALRAFDASSGRAPWPPFSLTLRSLSFLAQVSRPRAPPEPCRL